MYAQATELTLTYTHDINYVAQIDCWRVVVVMKC